eukprot:m.404822 g.404822  ORF g.404822 m.404822 type:complete len:615 (+) comp21201_c0_seq1:328-2172(+)
MATLSSFQGFGSYPALKVAELPDDVEDCSSINNWKVAWRRERDDSLIKRKSGRTKSSQRRRSRGEQPQLWTGCVAGLLDKTLLLQVSHASRPEDICSIRLGDRKLTHIHKDRLRDFTNLVHIDCAENRLNLQDFAVFPKLEVLELGLNEIREAIVPRASFACLSVLDLSYNLLGPECVRALRALPSLQSLDLSGNRLRSLPLNLAPTDFVALQNLILDDNKLTAPSPFQATALLPALEYLSVSHNAVAYIPRLVNDAPPSVHHSETPVFPRLRVLSITHNRLTRSADVLNAAAMPCLEVMHVWGNPISDKSAELPVEVQMELVDNCGIHVVKRMPAEYRPPPIPALNNMVVVREKKIVPVQVGGALRMLYERKAEEQFIRYSARRPPSSIGVLPPITGDTASNYHHNPKPGHALSQQPVAASPPAAIKLHTPQNASSMEIREPRNPYLPPTPTRSRTPAASYPEYFSHEHAAVEATRLGLRLASPVDTAAAPNIDGSDTASQALPPGVDYAPSHRERFAELFRDDGDDSDAEGPLVDGEMSRSRSNSKSHLVTNSLATNIKALRFALDHPISFARDAPTSGRAHLGAAPAWQSVNIDDVVQSLRARGATPAADI